MHDFLAAQHTTMCLNVHTYNYDKIIHCSLLASQLNNFDTDIEIICIKGNTYVYIKC